VTIAALLSATPASAAPPSAPAWSIDSFATPTDFSAADNSAKCETISGEELLEGNHPCDSYRVTVVDIGAKAAKSEAVTIEDTLPAGLTPHTVSLFWQGRREAPAPHEEPGPTELQFHLGRFCTLAPLRCTIPASYFAEAGHGLQPDDKLIMLIAVGVDQPPAPGPLTNLVEVHGGGAPAAEAVGLNTLEAGTPPFAVPSFTAPTLGYEGDPATQAGSHPYELSTKIDLNSVIREDASGEFGVTAVEDPRDVVVDLPPGLAGSALSTPEDCTLAQLASKPEIQGTSGCPAGSRIGYIRTYDLVGVNGPLYNLVPERGVAAELGFIDGISGTHALYISLAPTPQGYVLRTTASEITEIALTDILADIYGDPAARDGSGGEHVPTLTEPADCDGRPLRTVVHTDSWPAPAPYNPDGSPDFADPRWASASYESPPVTGCNQLAGLFKPTLTATPETNRGDSPTGLEVDLKVPQSEGTETLGTPPLKKAVVTLPEGMTVNPSSANGLEGCSLSALGMSPSGLPDAAPPDCPDASKIGTVELETPALPGVLTGDIYVARQTENPFHNLLSIYIVVDDPKTGVVVKLPGEITADPVTGQLSTVVDNSPQFPFSELRTKFFGGTKAPLRTPAVCGTYKVTSQLTPWSAPESGPPATPSASFKITQGCAPSTAEEPDQPGFEAGTLSPLAGAYSPFVLKLRREDGSQELKGLSVTLPQGLIGRLAGLTECSDAALAAAAAVSGSAEQASPSCPSSSEVGTVTVGAGAGLTPYYATGHAYLAGPYKGAPLSLAIITPAVAGPYDLGDVVVRNALEVNPETTQITAVSDEIPHILQGIPLDVRSIALDMDKPDFTLNPTSCEKKQITGTASTVPGQSAALTDSFQVGGCKNLGFKPHLALSLKGSTRHAGHPALRAVLTYPKGSYANIAKAQVNLPGSEFIDQGNLNKTCTKPVLLAGACPASSVYGKVKAWTPLLARPLEGPVYLVGGYGYKLPALVAELDGQIRVLLVGRVDSGPNKGIRNTFEAVPDAPVEKFELQLKGGPKYSLLENSEDLCARPQKAIADFTAQNGRVLDLTPTIANSCKGKKGGRHGKKHKGKKGKGAGGHGKASKRSPDSLELSSLLGVW